MLPHMREHSSRSPNLAKADVLPTAYISRQLNCIKVTQNAFLQNQQSLVHRLFPHPPQPHANSTSQGAQINVTSQCSFENPPESTLNLDALTHQRQINIRIPPKASWLQQKTKQIDRLDSGKLGSILHYTGTHLFNAVLASSSRRARRSVSRFYRIVPALPSDE